MNGSKEKKRILTLILAVSMVIASVFPAYAGHWECIEDGKYKYIKDDDTYCKSEWLFDDGYWFHFGEDEIMQTGWITDGTVSNADTQTGKVTQSEEQEAETESSENAETAETSQEEEDLRKWYYLESDPDSTIPLGGCYLDTITPDGYTVDADGLFKDMTEEASSSELIGRLAAGWALMHLGDKYSQEKRMENGYFDCSSLVFRAYRSVGLDISYNGDNTAAGIAKKMMTERKLVSRKNLEVGDLVFYKNEVEEEPDRYLDIGHVSMILSTDGPVWLVVSASKTEGKVIVDDFSPYGQCIFARPGKNVSEEGYLNRLLETVKKNDADDAE